MGVAPVLDVERPVLAVVRRTEAGVALGADEVREDVVVPPAGGAVLVAPGVVVGRVAADVDFAFIDEQPPSAFIRGQYARRLCSCFCSVVV